MSSSAPTAGGAGRSNKDKGPALREFPARSWELYPQLPKDTEGVKQWSQVNSSVFVRENAL